MATLPDIGCFSPRNFDRILPILVSKVFTYTTMQKRRLPLLSYLGLLQSSLRPGLSLRNLESCTRQYIEENTNRNFTLCLSWFPISVSKSRRSVMIFCANCQCMGLCLRRKIAVKCFSHRDASPSSIIL